MFNECANGWRRILPLDEATGVGRTGASHAHAAVVGDFAVNQFGGAAGSMLENFEHGFSQVM